MDRPTVNAYDAKAAEFAATYAAADVNGLHRFLLRHLPAAPCHVLEIGCGIGRAAAFLARNGYSVTGIEPSAGMLAAAQSAHRALIDAGTLRFVAAAFPPPSDAPPIEGAFDAVLALAVLMHVPDSELFEFAFQARGLLADGGVLILSSSTNRPGLDADGRDDAGRLFRERPAAELSLLFERLGFRLVDRQDADDSQGRPGLRWHTLVLRLDAGAGTRPVDQIETIINRDKKDATYKFALLRALCDVAQNHYRHVEWHPDDTVSVPLGLLAERWLYYYWPLIDTDDGLFIPQKRGLEKTKPIAFRHQLSDLASHFRNQNGLSGFHAAYQAEALDATARALTDAALNKIANTIVVGPVTFASQGDFTMDNGPRTAKRRCTTPSGVLGALGRVHFRADVWRELCLVGHWIGEAIVLRWAELTHEISERQVPVHRVIERLLIRPETERDVQAARDLFKTLTGLTCVWTEVPLADWEFDVDHVIPFALWHNNDLWNLVPAARTVNNQKRDRLVTRDTLLGSRERLIHCWQVQRCQRPQRFDVEVSRTLLSRNGPETNWEKPAFAALVEAVETLAVQRGVERWAPDAAAGRRRPARVRTASAAPCAESAPVACAAPALVAFPELAADEPFRTALPVVADLAAGPLQAGFETASLDDLADCDWVRVPPRVARPKRFVARIAGESMAPTLCPGDLVVFEYHRTPRADGQIVIVADFPSDAAPGDCAVKRYRAAPDAWRFTSDNPAFPDVRIPKSEQPVHPILGTTVRNLTRDRRV